MGAWIKGRQVEGDGSLGLLMQAARAGSGPNMFLAFSGNGKGPQVLMRAPDRIGGKDETLKSMSFLKTEAEEALEDERNQGLDFFIVTLVKPPTKS